jgi:cytoskeletal protein CcmA (bactofilin family)
MMRILVSLALWLGAIGGPAAAQSINVSDVRAGGDVVIAKDTENIFAFGGRVSVKDSRAKTMLGAAGKIEVNNSTIDTVAIAAGNITMTGGAVKELKAAGGTVDLGLTVEGDLDAAGGQVTLAEAMSVKGDAEVVGGDVTARGTYGADLRIEAESAVVGGAVAGDLRIAARKITLLPGTTIGGDLSAPGLGALPEGVTVGGKQGLGAADKKSDGVNIKIDLDDKKETDRDDESGLISPSPIGMGSWLTVLVTLAACGALALGIAPQFVARAAERLAKQPLPSLGVGLLSLLAVPTALIAVGVTIIGIPFAVLGAAAYLIGIGLGVITLCLWGGLMVRTLANQPGQETRLPKLVGWTLMGFLALALLGAVPVVGRWIQILAVMTGAGAVLSTAWALRKSDAAAT